VENILGTPCGRGLRADVRRWREHWLAGLNDFLAVVVAGQASDPGALAASVRPAGRAAESPLPSGLQAERIGLPSSIPSFST